MFVEYLEVFICSETYKHLDDCDTAEVTFIRTVEKEKEYVTENKESKEDVAEDNESKEEVFKTSPAKESVDLKVSAKVVVYATAIFDGSPTGMMTQADEDFFGGNSFRTEPFEGGHK